MVKNLKLVCVKTINGEEHYLVQSFEGDENLDDIMDFDEAKVRKK